MSTEVQRVCECCEAEGGAEFLVDRRGDAYCPECHASLMGELQRMIDKLPQRIALCPQCAPEFYYPLADGEGLMCPTPECGLEMIVYERASLGAERADQWKDGIRSFELSVGADAERTAGTVARAPELTSGSEG